MTKLKLSICIPLRVRGEDRKRNWQVIANELTSIAERRGDIEIIAAEHGGTYAVGYDRIRRVHIEGEFCRSRARNVAWKSATSDLICFCDSDMLMPPQAWDRTIDEAQNYDCYSPYKKYWRLGPVKTANRIADCRFDFDAPINTKGSYQTRPKKGNFSGGISFFSRRLLCDIGGWDERFRDWGREDVAINRLLELGGYSTGWGNSLAVHLYHGKGQRVGFHRSKELFRREYCERTFTEILSRRGVALPRNYVTSAIQKFSGSPLLSICVAIKNRSQIDIGEGRISEAFPNSVKSLRRASNEIGPLELVVVDYTSEDWPLETWLSALESESFKIQFVRRDGPFSLGEGRNIAAQHASSDQLFFCDADILVSPQSLERGLVALAENRSAFPIFGDLSPDGELKNFRSYGYGLSFVPKIVWKAAGGFPHFQSWGGEDNVFFEQVKKQSQVSRYNDSGLRHQWHPENLRHENYTNPKRADYKKWKNASDYYRTIPGWFDFEDLYRQMVERFENGHFVEVGVYKGKSAAFMATEIQRYDKSIWLDCVDSFAGARIEAECTENLSPFWRTDFNDSPLTRADNVLKIVPMQSVEAASLYGDESLDFVFIDAEHTAKALTADINAWLPKVKPGGVLAGHDLAKEYPGVECALSKLLPGWSRCSKRSWCFEKSTLTDCNIAKTGPPLNHIGSVPRSAISFSLFGNRSIYCQGAIENVKQANAFYPGWDVLIYVDDSVPEITLKHLRSEGAIVLKPDIDIHPTLFRILPLADPSYSYVCVRDADSRFSYREVDAVAAWITSGKSAHFMRDHPYHRDAILAGMWGFKGGLIPDIEERLRRINCKDFKSDQRWLARELWPIVRDDCIQHDSYGKFDGIVRPFPTARSDERFVGEIINADGSSKFGNRHGLITADTRRETVNVVSTGFWEGFTLAAFTKRFGTTFPFQFVESDSPSIIVCGAKTNDSVLAHLKQKYPTATTVLFAGENVAPNFERYDYCITFHRDISNDRHLRWPLCIAHINELPDGMRRLTSPGIRGTRLNRASFVASNPRCKLRTEFVKQLMEHFPVDCGGKVMNNASLAPGFEAKIEHLTSYRFNLCFENESVQGNEGYVTEKLTHAMIAGCIPVYWGDRRVGEDFNKKSFLDLSRCETVTEMVERFLSFAKDEARLKAMEQEPWFENNTTPQMFRDETATAFWQGIIDDARAKQRQLPLAIVLGSFSGGTSCVATMLKALGVDMGECQLHCEDDALADICRQAFPEPELTQQTPDEQIIEQLIEWRAKRSSTNSSAIGAKHPTLCLMISHMLKAWGRCKFVNVFRPPAESTASLLRRDWKRFNRKSCQLIPVQLLDARSKGLDPVHDSDVLELTYAGVLARPEETVSSIIKFLNLEPTESQIVAAVSVVNQVMTNTY